MDIHILYNLGIKNMQTIQKKNMEISMSDYKTNYKDKY